MNCMAHHNPINVLKKTMAEKGWDQSELAQKSGVHQSLISRYLSGEAEIGPLNARRLSRVLGVGFESLLGRKYAA
jgi:transcriptional regulator with XRE-family HTH domain